MDGTALRQLAGKGLPIRYVLDTCVAAKKRSESKLS
jgi:hypothetical protein